jgi:hypothetical protein
MDKKEQSGGGTNTLGGSKENALGSLLLSHERGRRENGEHSSSCHQNPPPIGREYLNRRIFSNKNYGEKGTKKDHAVLEV